MHVKPPRSQQQQRCTAERCSMCTWCNLTPALHAGVTEQQVLDSVQVTTYLQSHICVSAEASKEDELGKEFSRTEVRARCQTSITCTAGSAGDALHPPAARQPAAAHARPGHGRGESEPRARRRRSTYRLYVPNSVGGHGQPQTWEAGLRSDCVVMYCTLSACHCAAQDCDLHVVTWDPAASVQQQLAGGADQRLLQGASPLSRDSCDLCCWHGQASGA